MSHSYNFTPIESIKSRTVKARGQNIDSLRWDQRHPSLVSNRSSLRRSVAVKIKAKDESRKIKVIKVIGKEE